MSPIGDEDVKINLVRDTTWLIQKPQWGSNIHCISAANKDMSENIISHMLESRFESVIESLVTYLVLYSLLVLMVTFTGDIVQQKIV